MAYKHKNSIQRRNARFLRTRITNGSSGASSLPFSQSEVFISDLI